MSLLFFLGQTSDLCWEEIRVVLARFGFPEAFRLSETLAQLTCDDDLISDDQIRELQHVLGGTTKIVRILETLPFDEKDAVFDRVSAWLVSLKAKRFLVAEHGRDHLPRLNHSDLKDILHQNGIAASYHEASRSGVNAATLEHRDLTELHVIQMKDQILLARTVSWHDVDEWGARDFGKPARSRERGMLSPKIARMLVNLAIGANKPEDSCVLDPFCGTGTILLESSVLGVPHILGNDSSSSAIIDTEKNMTWWIAQSHTPSEYNLTMKTAEALRGKDLKWAPTCVATEPFLGKLTPNPQQIPGIMRGLSKMYRGTFEAMTEYLEAGSRVVFLAPEFSVKNRPLQIESLPKVWEEFGFRVLAGPVRAGRPNAHTQRLAYVLEYTPYGSR